MTRDEFNDTAEYSTICDIMHEFGFQKHQCDMLLEWVFQTFYAYNIPESRNTLQMIKILTDTMQKLEFSREQKLAVYEDILGDIYFNPDDFYIIRYSNNYN